MIGGLLKILGAKEVADSVAGSETPEVKGPGLLKQAGSLGWAALKTAYSPSGRNHLSEWNENRKADNRYRQDVNEQRRYQDDFLKKLDLVMNGSSFNSSQGRNITRMSGSVDRSAEDLFRRAPSSFSKLTGNFNKFTLSDVKGTNITDLTSQINTNFRKISEQVSTINSAVKIKSDELGKFETDLNDRLSKLASINQAQAQRFNAQVDNNLNTIESTLHQLSMKIDIQDRQIDMLAHKLSFDDRRSSSGMGFGQAGPISTGISRAASYLPQQSFGQNPLWWLAMAGLTSPTLLGMAGKLAVGGVIAKGAVDYQQIRDSTADQTKERWEKEGFNWYERTAYGGGYDHEPSRQKALKWYETQKGRENKIAQKQKEGLTHKEAVAWVDDEIDKRKDHIRQNRIGNMGQGTGEPGGWFADDRLTGTGSQTLMGEDEARIPNQIRGGAYTGGGISGDAGRLSFLEKMAKSKYRPPSPISKATKGVKPLFGIPDTARSIASTLFGDDKPTTNAPEAPVKVETVDYEIKSQELIHIESQREITLISKSKIVLDAPEIEFKTDRLIFPNVETARGGAAAGGAAAPKGGPGFVLGEKMGRALGIPTQADQMKRLQAFMEGTSPAGKAAMGGIGGGSVPVPSVGQTGTGGGGFESPESIILKQGANPNDPSITSSMIDDALKTKGLHEVKDREAIKQYLKTGGVNMDPATTKWCAAFVNSTLQQHGIKGSGSQMAASFNRWGQGVEWGDAKKGDVLSRAGHVGFFTGRVNEKGEYEMLGGNQSNRVTTNWVKPGSYNVRRAILDEKHQIRLPGTQTPQGVAMQPMKGTGNIPVDARGSVDKQSYYNELLAKVSQSRLNGFVPKDGQKYGIDGSPQSWTNFLTRVTSQESGFNVNSVNASDPGGSFGLFQFGNHYGINQENWRDPNAQIDAALTYADKWVVDGGGYVNPPAGVEAKRYNGYGGFGAAFGSVRRGEEDAARHHNIANQLAMGAPQLTPGVQPQQPVTGTSDPGAMGLSPDSFWKDGSTPSHAERRQVFAQGGVVVNLDTNSGPVGKQTGPLVVIPDNATPEQRKYAEEYVKKIEDAYKAKFGSSVKGVVKTRSENKRGRPGTIHTEPFAVTDTKAVDYFSRDPEGKAKLADITASTLGKVPGVKFSLPHEPYNDGKRDMGAYGSGTNEVEIARGLMTDLKGRVGQVAPIHQTNAGREVPGIPTPQAVMRRTVTRENTHTQGYTDDAPYKGRGGGPNPRSELLPSDKPAPPTAFGFGKKFGEAVLPKPHGRGTPGMPMVKKEDLPKPKSPPKPGDLSGRASRDKNPRQETRATQTAEEKARGARGGAYAGSMANQERETGVRGDSGTPPPDAGTDIRNPRNDSGDSNPPAPGDDGTGSYDSICYV